MNQTKRIITFIALCLLIALPCAGQDTLRRNSLPEVSIIQRNTHPVVVLSQTPVQVTTEEQIEKLGDVQLSDAVQRMAGVTLKDYGGIGGIKTVSARGLGSQFSTLTIDGVAVTDCQNGQVDLGRYLLGNSSHISLSNGQTDSPLNSARNYAAGSIINMETHEPEFGSRPINLKLGLAGGSFGYISPTLSLEQRISSKMSLALWGNYTHNEGNYPFTLYYTNTHTDSSSLEHRTNSQVNVGNADMNLFYNFDSRHRLQVKAHYMKGYHALPGPVIFYSTRGSEHSEEELFFAQARYRQTSEHWDIQLLGKHQRSLDIYEDTAARNAAHLIHNEYHQQESYLSQVVRYHTAQKVKGREALSVSLSMDESVAYLQSNLSTHNEVQRRSALGALALEYLPQFSPSIKGLRLDAHLLGTYIRDYETGKESSPYTKISPFAGLSYPMGNFILRYFFKETYRVPNFNELYYFTIGRTLRPEKALQHNLGMTYQSNTYPIAPSQMMRHTVTADVYFNRVADKIIAIPVQNMFLWSMTNLGVVHIVGLDITTETSLRGSFDLNRPVRYDIILQAGYSLQYAVDRTDPKSKVYGHQIPYTPRHSGNIALTATSPWVDLGYSVMLVGRRYSMQQNTANALVKGYVDQGITLSREFFFNSSTLRAQIQVLNIFDVQYEVVKSYPMMGRNYRLGITWKI
ncbi:MAG: TonB-dependent receptor [Bacteroidales bacterium]|nr:TonB-dependent receptor [Bacteroidales bacterium]